MSVQKEIEFAAAEWRNIQFELDEISARIAVVLQYDKSIPAARIAKTITDVQRKCEKRADLLYRLLDIGEGRDQK